MVYILYLSGTIEEGRFLTSSPRGSEGESF
jgi:hypothetical protein